MELGQALMMAAESAPRVHHAKGEKSVRAKLTEAAVREIRAEPRISRAALAKKYGVCETTIHAVRAREKWTHVR
jgi:DNA-binding transcriptional regulator YiaG